VPDERCGEMVVAIVEPAAGVTLTEQELIDHVKTRLAGFKAPRRVRVVPSIGRAPNGKLDYRGQKQAASDWLGRATG
jgi:3-oxocholest-4-en-26-oate---CoA ligase